MSAIHASDLAPSRTLQRQPSRWRLRLSRFLRGQRRAKELNAQTLSRSPPRLAPISSTASTFQYGNIADDFARLKFDEKGDLGSFDLDFDTTGDFRGFQQKREVSGGSEREPEIDNNLKVDLKQRPSKSAAGERTSRHISSAPSIDLPRDELDVDKGFLDSWLSNAVQEGKLSDAKGDEKLSQAGTVIKRQSMQTRTPIASQFATVAPPIASQFSTSRPTSMAISTKEKLTFDGTETYGSPGQKRKAEEDAPTSPSKRGSVVHTGMTTLPSSTAKHDTGMKSEVLTHAASTRQSVDLSHSNSRHNSTAGKRLSVNIDDMRSRNLSVASKRHSMGSDIGSETTHRTSIGSKRLSVGSMVPAEARQIEYQKPTSVPSLIDSETTSTASTSPTMAGSISSLSSNKRFEVKTASLLTPVSRTSTDKQVVPVANTLPRFNGSSMPPPSAPLRAGGDRRVAIEGFSSSAIADDRARSRRIPHSPITNNYLDGSRSGSPVSHSRSTTPEPSHHSEVMPRVRRTSSRLSDRMSWLRELDEASGKQTGRDFVFRKMEGGVAAKLAAFETKKSGAISGTQIPSGAGVTMAPSRSNSITSRQSSSEMYGIESNKLNRRSMTEAPGSVSNLVNDDFKQKLESMTGNLADKISKGPQSGQAVVANARGPAAMAAARKKIPQDVLDFIALSGADPEVAINEYLQQGNQFGKTKHWDHEEILKQIDDLETFQPKSIHDTPIKDKPMELPVVPVVPDISSKPIELKMATADKDDKIEPSVPTPICEEVVSPATGTFKTKTQTMQPSVQAPAENLPTQSTAELTAELTTESAVGATAESIAESTPESKSLGPIPQAKSAAAESTDMEYTPQAKSAEGTAEREASKRLVATKIPTIKSQEFNPAALPQFA